MKSATLVSLSALLLLAQTAVATPLRARQYNTSYTTSFTTYIADYVCGADGNPDIVFPGNITSGVCLKFRADSYLITPLTNVSCTFSTYNGEGCVPANLDTSNTYALPAGGAPVCAYGGVPDGGLHYLRSGLFTCP